MPDGSQGIGGAPGTGAGGGSLWIRDAQVGKVGQQVRQVGQGNEAAQGAQGGEATPVSVLVRGGIIQAMGPGVAPPPEEPVARVLDATGLHLFPSFRNGHTHAAMTLFRGWGDDMPLMPWLETRIWPAEARLTAKDVYRGARLAGLEMIRSGTTYLNDMYWHHRAVARAVGELGLRAHVGAAFLDFGDAERARREREAALRHLEARDDLGPRIRLSLSPHAIYTVSAESLAWLGERARSDGLLLHIHLSETRGEVENCLAEHGVRPAHFLDRLGLVGPWLVAAHGTYLDPGEIEVLAEGGATVVTNPTANLKLATGGIFDYAGARAAGLRVVLGTDGPASNNNLDMVEEMKVAALLQKHRAEDATCLPAREALSLATEAPGEVFGPGPGRVEVGAPADLVLVDLSHPSTQPLHDPVSALVYAAGGRAVHSTICDGHVLMHAGQVEGVDEEEVVAHAVESARRVTGPRY